MECKLEFILFNEIDSHEGRSFSQIDIEDTKNKCDAKI